MSTPSVVAGAARVVPAGATRIHIGKARLGYIHTPKRKSGWRLDAQRVRDIERAIEHRHGGPCDTDDGETYLILAANCLLPKLLISNAGRSNPIALAEGRMMKWAATWVPLVPAAAASSIIARAIAQPRSFRADAAARVIRLTMAERMAAGITTIGAIDCDRAHRAELAKDRRRLRQRTAAAEKRRAAGSKVRPDYEASSIAELARAHGVSRVTIYAWIKSGKIERQSDRSVSTRNKRLHYVGRQTCKPQAKVILPPSPSGKVGWSSTDEGRKNRIAYAACAWLGLDASHRIDGEYPDTAILKRIPSSSLIELVRRCRNKELNNSTVAFVVAGLGIQPAVPIVSLQKAYA